MTQEGQSRRMTIQRNIPIFVSKIEVDKKGNIQSGLKRKQGDLRRLCRWLHTIAGKVPEIESGGRDFSHGG